MNFIPSTLLALFAATFLGIWLIERNRHHLLWFSAAFLIYSSAFLCQILLPDDVINTVVSAALYISGTFAFGHGVMMRSGRRLGWLFQVLSLALIIVPLFYYDAVAPSLLVRIYVLNLGLGAIFLLISWQARFLWRGQTPDRCLLAATVFIGLHFIPRLLLTVNNAPDLNAAATQSLFWEWLEFSLVVIGSAAGVCLLVITGADVIQSLQRERNSDALTGLLNRRGLDAEFDHATPKRRASDRTCAVVSDVDHFKRINDHYGHATGDLILKNVASILKKISREGDLVGRSGGEEFVIILRDCDIREAHALAERIRLALASMNVAELAPEHQLTCSFGVSQFEPGENLWSAINRADKHLYAAKKAGRDCVVSTLSP